MLAAVLLAVNNLRDIDTDVKASTWEFKPSGKSRTQTNVMMCADKRTLAVRFGAKFARYEISSLLFFAFGCDMYWLYRGYYIVCMATLLVLPMAMSLVCRDCEHMPSKSSAFWFSG